MVERLEDPQSELTWAMRSNNTEAGGSPRAAHVAPPGVYRLHLHCPAWHEDCEDLD